MPRECNSKGWQSVWAMFYEVGSVYRPRGHWLLRARRVHARAPRVYRNLTSLHFCNIVLALIGCECRVNSLQSKGRIEACFDTITCVNPALVNHSWLMSKSSILVATYWYWCLKSRNSTQWRNDVGFLYTRPGRKRAYMYRAYIFCHWCGAQGTLHCFSFQFQ